MEKPCDILQTHNVLTMFLWVMKCMWTLVLSKDLLKIVINTWFFEETLSVISQWPCLVLFCKKCLSFSQGRKSFWEYIFQNSSRNLFVLRGYPNGKHHMETFYRFLHLQKGYISILHVYILEFSRYSHYKTKNRTENSSTVTCFFLGGITSWIKQQNHYVLCNLVLLLACFTLLILEINSELSWKLHIVAHLNI